MNARTGREVPLRPPARAASRLRIVVVGAGPAGLAAAAEACGAHHEVIVLERGERIGGQLALAGEAPMHAETARTLAANYAHLLDRADVRLGRAAQPADVVGLDPSAAIVATGAVPFMPHLPLGGPVLGAWDVLAGARPEGESVLIADWGGDPSGLAAAELLATAGKRVIVALAAVAVGESIHQYARNVYLERLYRAGVRIEHHLELIESRPGAVRLRNLFAPELEVELSTDALVLALGRTPVDDLAPALRTLGLRVEEAGDCRTPRSLEEATLEGVLAARALVP
jgi:pyruvate/2-oxoglutarate dehydrogenase complex dihydrolipoamide dehydrogenase (E3) component